jgi:hypothetical protein
MMRMPMVLGIVVVSVGLAQVSPAFIAGDGKGKPDRDCYIGLEGYSPEDLVPISKNGKKQGIACTDCDPACDLDGVATPNGSCTFSVGACVNNTGVPGCDPTTRDPKKLKAQAKSKAGTIDLGTTFPGDLSSACSAFVDFPVPLKGNQQNKPGKGKVTLLAKKKTDKDKFTFVCNPRPAGEACPAPPTTTTSTIAGSTTSTTTSTVTSTTTVTSTSTVTSSSTSSSTTSTSGTTTTTSTTIMTTTSTTPTSTTSTSLAPTTSTTTITTTTTTTSTSLAPTTSTTTSTTTTTIGSPAGAFVD